MIKKSKKKNTDVARDIEKRAKADKKIIEKIIEHNEPKHDLVDRSPLYHILDDIRELINKKPLDAYTYRNIEVALRKTVSKIQDAGK
jgi:hypothetical protein